MTKKTHVRTLTVIGSLAIAAAIATSAVAQRRASPYAYDSGKDLYEHICQGCHMPDGKGAAGAGIYPALAGNAKLKAPLYPVLVILRGQKAMPSFSELSDAQVAAVTNYIRTGFGNSAQGQVTAEQVKDQRSRAVKQEALRPG